MIYYLAMAASVSTVLIIGQPRSWAAAYINRLMLFVFAFALGSAITYHGFGFSMLEFLKKAVTDG